MADDDQPRDEPRPRDERRGEEELPAQEEQDGLDGLLEEGEEQTGSRWATSTRVWAALAGAFLLGALVAALVGLLGGPAGQDGETVARAELVGMDSSVEDANAELLESDERRTLRIRAGELPDVADGYVQVWLTDSEGARLVPLGVLEAGETDLIVPSTLDLAGYPLVEVSLETYDDEPGHSGRTLWRGQLDSPAT